MTSVPFAERGGAVRGLLDLATGCYPAFLFGGPVGALPVFHFHEVTRAWLEPRLQYLVDNGYRTVTCDEIARLVVDGVHPGPRSVALTFDDAWSSAWTVATPLLQRLKLRAIVFAIPARISDAPAPRATADEAGPTDGGAHYMPGQSPQPPASSMFVTWPELRAMHNSGVFDVQSHTRAHAKIFCDAAVTGFVAPGFAAEPYLDRPLAAATNGSVRFVEPEALGTPLYLRRSRMSDARRFLPDEGTAERCRQHVARNGGAQFFDRPAWRAELEPLAAGNGRFETDDEQETAIRDEMAEGRAMLNARLGATGVRHLALPWGIAGDVTRRLLQDSGHVTAFAERPLRRRGVRAGDDRYGLMRLNSKFLMCLPGRGRQWFFTAVS
jgi:hypothetical protein